MRLVTLLLLSIAAWAAPAPIQRIVSTAPSITETLFAIGLGPQVVGVTIYCKYPEQVLKLPKIGTYLKPDVETIIGLHPDLVIVQKQGNHLGEQLALLHIRYIEVQSYNLDDIYNGALTIGKATGHEHSAQTFISGMRAQFQNIAATASRVHPKPSAVFIVGHNPGTLEGLIAGAGSSYFSDLLGAAGATNIFSDAVSPYPKVSLEEVLSRDPDFIFELSGDTRAKQEEVLGLWQAHTSLRAVKNHHTFAVPSAPFLVPGPRAPEAARLLLHMLHPELER